MIPFDTATNASGNKNEITININSLDVNFIDPIFSFGFNDKSFKSEVFVLIFTLYKNNNAPEPKIIYASVSMYDSIMVLLYYV